jgi:hypothetical protein
MKMINQEKPVSFAGEQTKKRQKNKKKYVTNEIGWIPVDGPLKEVHSKVITTPPQR